MPNLYAVADDWRSWGQGDSYPLTVAAHVHAETIPAAMSPGGIDRDALLNSSADAVLCDVYRFCSFEMAIMQRENAQPMPIWG